MITLTVTEAKSKFLSVLRKCHEVGESCSLTLNGKPYAVILGQQEYEGILETIEILQDKKLSRKLLTTLREADQGKTISFDKAIGRPQRR